MKVTKDGKVGNLKNWKTKVACKKKDEHDSSGCGAKLKVTFTDLVLMYWHGTHFPHYYSAVKCPQCGKYNRVKNVPAPLWEKLSTSKNKEKAIFDGLSEEI